MRGSGLSRAVMWAVMRRFAQKDKCFTVADLGEGRAPRRYLDLLLDHHYVEVHDPGVPQAGQCATYRLVKNPGPSAPIKFRDGLYDPNCAGEIHDPLLRIWFALQRFRWLTLRELCVHANADPQTTRKYARALERLGYLQTCRLAPRRVKGLVLIKNTGPAAPIPEPGTGRLFDPNLGVFVEVRNEAA